MARGRVFLPRRLSDADREPIEATRAVGGLTNLMFALCLAGCATVPQAFPTATAELVFTLNTEPRGVEVYLQDDSQQSGVKLGETPSHFPLQIERIAAGSTFLLRLKPHFWQASMDTETPLIFMQDRRMFSVAFPDLELRHPGYEPQAFTDGWGIPNSLRRSSGPKVKGSVRTYEQNSVVWEGWGAGHG